MRYVLIPVKDLARAKQRLAALMSQDERTRLAEEMMKRTLTAAAGTRKADRVAIVTLYPPAIELAAGLGIEVILESRQISESDSVDYGSGEAVRRGATAVLRLPIDLPLIAAEEIDGLLDEDGGEPAALLVPSRDRTGTNALLRRPPEVFPSRFGTGSLTRHLDEARQAGVPCRVIERPRLGLDIDEPEDVAELLRHYPSSPIARLLCAMGIERRL